MQNYVIKKDPNGKEVKVILYSKSASAIIPYKDGYVVVRRIGNPYSGYLALAGGKADFDTETPEQNCIREVKEETGLDVEIDFKIKTDIEVATFMGETVRYESTCFAVKVVGGELKRQEDECSEIKILSVEEMVNTKLAFKHNMMFDTYLDMLLP